MLDRTPTQGDDDHRRREQGQRAFQCSCADHRLRRGSIQGAGVDASSSGSHRAAASSVPVASMPRVRIHQKYRMRAPSSGREVIIEAEPGQAYVDRDTGEELEVVGELLPLAPTPSELPWAVENLRFCNWCDQLCQKDLNDCPVCGRRMDPLPN